MSLITLQHHDRVFVRDETLAQGQPTRHRTTSRTRIIPHQKQIIPSGTRSTCKLPCDKAACRQKHRNKRRLADRPAHQLRQ
ncbi:uncharacterized protein BKA55DRAFT_319339 [Fusarium redolens]|uniref:Uncharacterized protein n=1 Tax=Fusarium redolens TaxID=48865 RepID=A0A9P9HDL0_FUSRE|nr:uncharacterized protein BKA55DRAFT_319339 [Fusarium redolens]KAH7255545.1 hypothetical protein BKA55DRAFT_319339 [Fusarium redolens]